MMSRACSRTYTSNRKAVGTHGVSMDEDTSHDDRNKAEHDLKGAHYYHPEGGLLDVLFLLIVHDCCWCGIPLLGHCGVGHCRVRAGLAVYENGYCRSSYCCGGDEGLRKTNGQRGGRRLLHGAIRKLESQWNFELADQTPPLPLQQSLTMPNAGQGRIPSEGAPGSKAEMARC